MADPLKPSNEDLYREIGDPVGGYAETGPYHCANCIHKPSPDAPYCNHVVLTASPYLADRLVEVDGQKLIQINLEKGCCRFVKPPDVVALVMRHGDTVLNEEGKLRSRMDVDIDEKGQKQAQDAAQFLVKNYSNIKRIVVSPLKRTQQTVEPTAQALGIQPEIEPAINTWHMGVLIGQSKDENQDVLDYFVENPNQAIPEGESLSQVLSRSMPVIEKILEEAEEGQLTLICMTSSIIVPLIKYINGTPIEEPGDDVGIGPGGVMAISLSGDGYAIKPVFGEVKPAEVGAS